MPPIPDATDTSKTTDKSLSSPEIDPPADPAATATAAATTTTAAPPAAIRGAAASTETLADDDPRRIAMPPQAPRSEAHALGEIDSTAGVYGDAAIEWLRATARTVYEFLSGLGQSDRLTQAKAHLDEAVAHGVAHIRNTPRPIDEKAGTDVPSEI